MLATRVSVPFIVAATLAVGCAERQVSPVPNTSEAPARSAMTAPTYRLDGSGAPPATAPPETPPREASAESEEEENASAPAPVMATDAEIEAFIAKHPKLPAKHKSLLRAHTICLGMTADEVLLIRGEPADVNRTVTRYGTDEQWVYSTKDGKDVYLYFEKGKLTAVQD